MAETKNYVNNHYPVGYLYRHEMLEEVLKGLHEGLVMHNGRLCDVSRQDVLDSCKLSPITFDYFYQTPEAIAKEIYSTLKQIIAMVNQRKEMYHPSAVMSFLLGELTREPIMLKIVAITDELEVWEENLEPIMLYVAEEWNEFDEDTEDYAFSMFCIQFQTVLKKWGDLKFDPAYKKDILHLIEVWIDADTQIGKELMQLQNTNKID